MNNRRVVFILLLAGLVLLAGLLAVFFASSSPAAPAPQATGMVITQAPSPTPRVIDFTVKDLQGADVSVADLRGKVVMVNFWATWCSPCREEMPIIETFYRQHQGEDFVVVGINVSEDAATAAAYVQEQGFTFPIWSDPTGKQLMALGIRGLPASLFLDREGRLQQFWSGPVDADILDELALPMLAE